MPKWMMTDSNTWSKWVMRTFILDQNGYSYDDKHSIEHSCFALINFCGMTDKTKIKKFHNVYDNIYK